MATTTRKLKLSFSDSHFLKKTALIICCREAEYAAGKLCILSSKWDIVYLAAKMFITDI